MNVRINNQPAVVSKWVVASVVNNELWFYGSFENQDKAIRVADMIGGVCLETYKE